jgi:hypothetical protein
MPQHGGAVDQQPPAFLQICWGKTFHNHAIHHLGTMNGNDKTQVIEGTNVVRVPFGVRRARRRRPERPDHWATLVIPFQAGSDPTPPPQAA